MAELLPTRQAGDLRRAVADYVTTAVALADPVVERALRRFLTDPDVGVFQGPYVRTRLPFVEVGEGEPLLENLPSGFSPYAHQAAAYERLTSDPRRGGELDAFGMRVPEPTIVTTGTGSGKTEAFLHPVLDHVVRARAAGIQGVKALVLYPMNALANDQAQRLARLISGEPVYRGITAALYTGEASVNPRTLVDENGLITERETIRDAAPDILLTNYKMLDQLLLRVADRNLWVRSARSLRYLVLDEFHTYDGAQGTDVAMLLRRLRMVLERSAPGKVSLVPVATSATLGGDSEADAMRDFAHTVFGTPFPTDSVVTERRQDLDGYLAPARERVAGAAPGGRTLQPATITSESVRAVAFDGSGHLAPAAATDPAALTSDVIDLLWETDDPDVPASTLVDHGVVGPADLLLAHPLVDRLLAATARPRPERELATDLFPGLPPDVAATATSLLLAAVSHVRARSRGPEGGGRNAFPSVEAHLWIREVSRIDRTLTGAPEFRWSGDALGADRALPAVYCRHCGSSGWGIAVANVGDQLDLRPDAIRRQHVRRTGRFRAAIFDPGTGPTDGGGTSAEGVRSRRRYLDLDSETLELHGPDPEDGEARAIRVLVLTDQDADKDSNDDVCPSCDGRDGIRFVGSRVATLLSVVLSSLFGSRALDVDEKKALVFTDSVQDAAHRAGFVEARSHGLTMRSAVHAVLDDEPADLDTIVDRLVEVADTPESRYRLIHPTAARSERLAPFWSDGPRPATAKVRRLVGRRLGFDLGLEFGLTGQVGRTLLMTGCAVASVRVTDAELDDVARETFERAPLGVFDCLAPGERERRRWLRGVLERFRTQGAISHPWLDPFRREGGPMYKIWGGRPDPDVMPAFPPGRSVPALPSLGPRPTKSLLTDLTDTRTWYVDWTARALGIERRSAATVVRHAVETLLARGLVDEVTARSGDLRSFALVRDRVEVRRAPRVDADGAATGALTCTECGEIVTGPPEVLAVFVEGPCTRARCLGELRAHLIPDGYYRSLYDSDMRRVVAREHTSLLPTETRLAHETAFKASSVTPGAPNVLVATPTLEMGIDIGDLSTVLLASVPRSVASYLQRVGRAGRLTGNALDITFVSGRNVAGSLFTDPLDLIDGRVRPPGAYLSAEEILRRQFLASVMDRLAGDDRVLPPAHGVPVLRSSERGTYLGHVLEELTRSGPALVDEFLATFRGGTSPWSSMTPEAADALRAWVTPTTVEPHDGAPHDDARSAVHRAVARWRAEREDLRRRHGEIEENLRALEGSAEEGAAAARAKLTAENLLITQQAADLDMDLAPARSAEEDERDRRRLTAAAARLGGEIVDLESEHWIGTLERFGLLPNFTLVDDAVTLDATLVWEGDDGTWHHESSSIERNGASALRELAPGSHFYARGLELVVDAIDLGTRGSALHRTAFCPVCGVSTEVDPASPPAACRACGSARVADPGQHLDVVEMRRVFSTMSRNRALITDTDEERNTVGHDAALTIDLSGAETRSAWWIEESGLGFAFHRGALLTRLNLGRALDGAPQVTLGGEEKRVGGFLVCRECGHLDDHTGSNSPHEHQAWCGLRRAKDADTARVVLSRGITTEIVVVSLPESIRDDGSQDELWSFVAALRLGIDRHHGGAIGNLDVDVAMEPGRPGRRAVVLSDTIPGGTGYLAELSTPRGVREVLAAALDAVETCECSTHGLPACHRCLLPHVPVSRRENLSRRRASEILRGILRGSGAPEEDGHGGWTVSDGAADPDADFESSLERRFRQVVRKALENRPGVSTSAERSDAGEILTFRVDGRPFRLSPQVDVAGTRPDFVLTWQGQDVEGVAIYVDGVAYHASPAHNRVADDAAKRAALRDRGYLVYSVTHDDIERFEKRAGERGTGSLPRFVNPAVVDFAILRRELPEHARAVLGGTAVDQIIEIILRGGAATHLEIGRKLPLLMLEERLQRRVDRSHLVDIALAEHGVVVDTGEGVTEGADPAIVRHDGPLAISAALQEPCGIAVVLDDRRGDDGDGDFLDAWRTWNHVANLAQVPSEPGRIRVATVGQLDARRAGSTPTRPGTEVPRATPGVDGTGRSTDPAWAALEAEVMTTQELEVLRTVEAAGGPRPEVGEEYGGAVVDLAWPDHKIVFVVEPLPASARDELVGDGWRVLEGDVSAVPATLGLVKEDR